MLKKLGKEVSVSGKNWTTRSTRGNFCKWKSGQQLDLNEITAHFSQFKVRNVLRLQIHSEIIRFQMIKYDVWNLHIGLKIIKRLIPTNWFFKGRDERIWILIIEEVSAFLACMGTELF